MNPELDPTFTAALETALRDRVNTTRPAAHRSWWHRHCKLTIVVPLALIAVGGASAAAAAVLGAPGSTTTTVHGAPLIETHTGSATINLRTLPRDASALQVEVGCLTPGTITITGLTTITCDQTLVEAARAYGATEGGNMVAGITHLDVSTTPGAQWVLRVAAVDEETVPWATNSHGQTYGLPNEHGRPDLIATTGTDSDGKPIAGYTRRADTPEAAASPAPGKPSPRQTTTVVPLFSEDGAEQIGVAEVPASVR